ncbi:MAG: hypothetical protein GY844_00080, partial [Bradyrhizobium sp.]|nr:hypothetical protein [Bradyrhizobium sp.]
MQASPTDTPEGDRIVLAHGGGGELTSELIRRHIMPKLGNELLNPLADSAVLTIDAG